MWLVQHHEACARVWVCEREMKQRGLFLGSTLVKKTIQQMVNDGCDEVCSFCEWALCWCFNILSQVVLETEVTNRAALCLYENLGFVRDKYLHQYYLNGVDAYRLKLWLKEPPDSSYTS